MEQWSTVAPTWFRSIFTSWFRIKIFLKKNGGFLLHKPHLLIFCTGFITRQFELGMYDCTRTWFIRMDICCLASHQWGILFYMCLPKRETKRRNHLPRLVARHAQCCLVFCMWDRAGYPSWPVQRCQMETHMRHSRGSRGALWAWPPCPQDFFKIMQFSGNFKGKSPIFSKFWAQGPPLGVKTPLGLPD